MYLETTMGGINSHRDWSHHSHGNLEVRLALLFDVPEAGHCGSTIGYSVLAFLLIL